MKLCKYLIYAASALLLCSGGCRKKPVIKIGVAQCSDDDWRQKMNDEINREAIYNNVEVEIRSADDTNEKQISDLRYFAANDFDIILVAPNEAEAITPTIDSIMGRGIPVVVFDRSVTSDNYTAFQGADNDSIGAQVASYIHHLPVERKQVIELLGNPASTPAQGRHDGYMERVKDFDDVEPVGSAIGNWTYEEALPLMDSLFTTFPEANVVYAHNDRMALAAREAADRAGRAMYVIGVDGAPTIGMKAVAEGDLTASFIYPTAGHQLVRTALDILNGRDYVKHNEIDGASAIDESNAAILLQQARNLSEETANMVNLKSQIDQYWRVHNIQTVFLYSLVVLLLLLFIIFALFLRAFWGKQKQEKLLIEKNHELEVQRDNEVQLNAQLQQATQAKLMFFTNVSHDLRTPLTLIAEPVKQLLHAGGLTPAERSLATLAHKNVRILQRLINQVLDFRKYESGYLHFNPTEVSIGQLFNDWTDAFRTVARARHMKLNLDNTIPADVHIGLDVEKIERVYFNLLSNAFKYTPDNGRIDVKTLIAGENLEISVADNGRGISEEDLGNIFDRFFQTEKVHPTGSGIGLSLAKAFVEMHGGTISVESEPGKGSCFIVRVPVIHVAAAPEVVKGNITDADVSLELNRIERDELAAPQPQPAADGEDARPLLLVIDDNADIQALIGALLADQYRILTAPNGAEGVRMAAKYVPDLIICDVMMPVMDGLECCRRIKSEVSTSHVPVLMLTACSMDEQRVQGYESGADGYVSKPFNNEVLRARCASLIANRRRILDLYRTTAVSAAPQAAAAESVTPTEAHASSPRPLPIGEIDNEFYNRFLEILHQRLSDSEINVDALAAEMGLGRSQFYRKIKALTNFSPVELIRNVRLKEARHMLLTTEMSVSEIAYGVGFSTPAYFTKCYRETFGETPSDTRNKLVK